MADNWETSLDLWTRAKRSIAGGVNSNVRGRARPFPLFFERAKGPYLYDVDGHEYVDYVLGQGPMILGHNPSAVIAAVKEVLDRGQLFAGQHALEVELAERLCAILPCAEQVRFSSTGSEAVQAAVRVARAFTGRRKIIKFEGHYHGWLDNILVSVAPLPGDAGPRDKPNAVPGSEGQPVPTDVVVVAWNDLDLVEAALARESGDVAAIIMEPIMCNTGVILPRPGYLEGVRALCNRTGALLIFDEVITGFRVGLAGAQGLFGVVPDLAVFGKAMASGFPLSCTAGRADVLELIASQRANHSGTFNANLTSVRAALSTLDLLCGDQNPYERVERSGRELMDGIREIARRRNKELLVQGLPSIFYVGFAGVPALWEYRDIWESDSERYNELCVGLLERGVYVTNRGAWYLSAAHENAQIGRTLNAFDEALSQLG